MANITPNRTLRLFYDIDEQVITEKYWGGIRMASDISSVAAQNGGRDSVSSNSVRYWPRARCWTLRPLQDDPTKLQEASAAIASLDPFLDFSFTEPVANMKIRQIWAQVLNATGIVYDSSVLSQTIEKFYQKEVPATGSYTLTFPHSRPAPQDGTCLPGPHADMDSLPEHAHLIPDEGWVIYWMVPGLHAHYPDNILNFHFGQYCLVVAGSGLLHLCEYCAPAGGGANRWTLRKTFRYSRPGSAVNTLHTLSIFPLYGAGGEKYIVFSSVSADAGSGVPAGAVLTAGNAPSASATPFEEIYEAEPLIRQGDPDPYPDDITGPGFRFDIRRDLRVAFALSYLRFYGGGVVTDGAWGLPPQGSTRAINGRVFARIPDAPPGSTAVPQITVHSFNAADATSYGTAVLTPSSGLNFTTSGVPAAVGLAQNFIFGNSLAAAYLTRTPILYGYELQRPEVTANLSPGAVAAQVVTLNLSASCPDARQDTADAVIKDATDAHHRLRNRGEMSAKIGVSATGLGVSGTDTAKVTLFRGKITRPRYQRWPKSPTVGGGDTGSNATRVYPADGAGTYSVLMQGMYSRAKEWVKTLIDARMFASDDAQIGTGVGVAAVSDFFVPWKVTDAIRWMLQRTGLPNAMIAIPDIDIRLYAGLGPASDMWYEPYAGVIDRCIAFARNYLGGYLIFDPNSGPLVTDMARPDVGYPEGAWTILFTPEEGATPIFDFATAAPSGLKDPVHPGTYGVAGTFIADTNESYCVAPEANHIIVFTAPPIQGTKGFKIPCERYNMHSYAVPGSTVTPDPDSPHYIGRERLYILPAPELTVGGPNGGVRTVQAVTLVADRLLQIIGRGRRIKPARAPLVLYKDPALDPGSGGRYRTLRFGDPVSINGVGGWYVRSVTPDISLSSAMMAHYEFERLEPL